MSSQPSCEVHGIPKSWVVDKHKKAGGRWRCKPCSRKYLSKYRRENASRLAPLDRERRSQYRADNADKVREYGLAYNREYRERNRESLKAKRQTESGILRLRDNDARRRAREKELCCPSCNGDGYSSFAVGKCYICLTRDAVQTDHVVPLARGGLHCRENFAGACMECNYQKNSHVWPEHPGWKNFVARMVQSAQGVASRINHPGIPVALVEEAADPA